MHNDSHHTVQSPGLSTAVIIAVLINGTILVLTAMLVVLCYVANNKRRKEQQEQGEVEMDLRDIEGEVGGRKGGESESLEDSSGKVERVRDRDVEVGKDGMCRQ
jgi:hypothetical protein